jgi:hypothetical protein
VIYFLRAREIGRVKIGYSANPKKRIASLQTASPTQLELIRIIEGTKDDEKDLHRKFAKLRIGGEWFTEKDELASYLGLAQRVEKKLEAPTWPATDLEWGWVRTNDEADAAGLIGYYDDDCRACEYDEECEHECNDEDCLHECACEPMAIVYFTRWEDNYHVVPYEWLDQAGDRDLDVLAHRMKFWSLAAKAAE